MQKPLSWRILAKPYSTLDLLITQQTLIPSASVVKSYVEFRNAPSAYAV